ncbi:MAG: aminomethyltransferase family protein [Acidimicrobiales bacterium]
MAEGAMRGTPFHPSTSARNTSTWWYGWGGYVVPDVYTDLHTEMAAIRSGVSMNEMSPIPKIEVRGADAQACVDYLIPRNVAKMDVGRAWYTPWCNDDGQVVADGIIFRFEPDRFIFSGDNCTEFLRQKSLPFDVEVTNRTDDYGILALQGPLSAHVLGNATGEDWSDLGFSRIRATEIAGAQVRVARQGFTGELGFELWVDRPNGHKVWEAVAEAGADSGIQPAGEYAIDIARVEAGLLLISAEYTTASGEDPSSDVPPNPVDYVTPYELNLGHCVKLDKPADFVGRDALAVEAERGPERRLVGLEFDSGELVQLALEHGLAPDISPRVRWDHLPLMHGDEVVGRASSVTWSPSVSALIGFGLVPTALSDPGIELSVQWSDYWGKGLGPASVRTRSYPFIELSRS